MLVVLSLFCGACLFTAGAQGWASLVVAFGTLRMLGPGALSFVSGNTLAFWFERRLGAVEGIRQVGMAAAMSMIPALNLWLVRTCGWRGAYTFLGIAIWCVLFPTFFCFYRDRTSYDANDHSIDVSTRVQASSHLIGLSLGQALRTYAFWVVTGGAALFGVVHTALFFCLVPILHERGLSELDAAAASMAFAMAMAAAQLASGILADRVPAPRLLFAGVLGLGAAVLLIWHSSTTGEATFAGAMLGASQGLFFGAENPLWARYFGLLHLGKIRGVLMTIKVGSSSLGPLIAGLAFDLTESFDTSLWLFAGISLPLAVLSWFAYAPRQPESIAQTVQSLEPCPT
jgi:MFS family permease